MKLLPVAILSLLMVGCSQTVSNLRETKNDHPISSLELEVGYNEYVHRAFLKEEKIECGRIGFADGDYADYWFQSHHMTDDAGYTLFAFSDGKEKVMEGWFCCEVQLPEEQLKNKNELMLFIAKHHGVWP